MSHTRKILQGSASNMARVILSMLVALVLPPLLVHRMEPAAYSAWMLILQTSAYITLLDLGLQTAIGKFVAEYDSVGDRLASSRTLSSSFAILCVSALVGALGISIVAWQVPQLFRQMPTALIGDVRVSILVVGLSSVFALPFGSFLAVFTGLQRYAFPTVLAMTNRLLSAAALAALLWKHGSLVQMAWLMAAFNIATAIGQYFGWRKFARKSIDFSYRFFHRESAMNLVKYGSILSVWTLATLFVSGLDMVIVGHYDFKNTGYYGISSSVTNFMLLIIGSLFGPILPAVSSMQSGRSPAQIGEMAIKTTRYCTLLLCIIGLPLILAAYPLLRLWVGHDYAFHSALFLQLLILGNVVRQFGYPYSLVVVATGKQHLATIAGIAEALVNVCLSIFLIRKMGAVGVALGTLTGAFVSIGVHLAVSMRRTRSTIALSRLVFVREGILRPLLCVIPSMLLLPFWQRFSTMPFRPSFIAIWTITTVGIAWFVGLTSAERDDMKEACRRLVYSTSSQG